MTFFTFLVKPLYFDEKIRFKVYFFCQEFKISTVASCHHSTRDEMPFNLTKLNESRTISSDIVCLSSGK